MTSRDEWLNVGTLVSPQGLKGELRVNPSSDFSERFTKPGQRWLQETDECPMEVQLINGRQLPGKTLFVVRLAGITNRDKAEELVGMKLLVKANNRPKLAKGEFHFLDLVGLEARLDKEKPAIGIVTDLNKGGNDLLEIELSNGRKVLVPFVKAIVPEVHISDGWLRLTPPKGLLEL